VPAGKAWRAVYYDTPRSLRPKLGLANSLGLAGAGFWALGYERGLPDYTALIGDFRAGRSMAVAAADPGASSSAGPVAGASADPLAPSLATGGAGSPSPSVVP
jgi:hypothetical protein